MGTILAGVPDSCLLLLATPGSHRQWVREILGREGIEPHRIEFVGKQPRKAYLETYQQCRALRRSARGGAAPAAPRRCGALHRGVGPRDQEISVIGEARNGPSQMNLRESNWMLGLRPRRPTSTRSWANVPIEVPSFGATL